MNDDINVGVEGTPPVEGEPDGNEPVEEDTGSGNKILDAINNLSAKFKGGEQESDIDELMDTYYGDDEEFDDFGSEPQEDTDGKKGAEYWKQRALNEEKGRKRAEARSRIKETRDWIKSETPNAWTKTVEKAIRNNLPPEQIKGIARSSELDFQRGLKLGRGEIGSELETLKAAVIAEAAGEAAVAFGSPPSGTASGGSGNMSITEYREAIKGMSEKDAAHLARRIRMSDGNPYKDAFK
jgi:hypothetical protein